MADRTLKLTATFNDAGALTGLKVLNAELGQTGQAASKTKPKVADLAATYAGLTVAAYGLARGAKAAYEAVSEGAALELSQDRFENLTASIGSTSDAMLTDLGTATAGMMSNAEMIASASQIISLGLADTGEGVVDLAALVSQLGWDMQQVILTFANNSIARLDALGLSVSDVKERAAALEAQGYDTDKAFDMAVIQAGQAKLELLGSAADTSVGGLARLEASWKNLVDTGKLFAASLAGPVVDAIDGPAQAYAQLITAFQEGNITYGETLEWYHKLIFTGTDYADVLTFLEARQNALNPALEASAQTYAEYVQAMVAAQVEGGRLDESVAAAMVTALTSAEATDTYSVRLRTLAQELGITGQATYEYSQQVEALDRIYAAAGVTTAQTTQEQEAQVTTLFELVQAYGKAGITSHSYADAQEAAAEATREAAAATTQALSDLQLWMQGPLGEAYDNFTQKNADLEAQAEELRQTIAELGGTEWMTPAQAGQISTLQAELNNVAAEIIQLDEAIESGELKNNQEYAATTKLETLRETAWELEQQIREMGGQPFVTSKNLEDIEAAKGQLAELNAAIAENAAQHRTATQEILFDLATQAAARDGITTAAEADMLVDLAYKWGLIDEVTRDAAVSTNAAFDAYNAGAITAEEALNRIINNEADLAFQTSLANVAIGEKGVGALTDYKSGLQELEAPLIHNAELIAGAAGSTAALNSQLNSIPSEIDITFNIHQNGRVPYFNGNPTGQTTQGQTNEDAEALEDWAVGTQNFVVPSGYPNDSYRIGLTSGEVVSVHTPAQQLRQAFGEFGGGGRGGVQIGSLNIYQMPGENAEALAQRVVKIIQEHNR